MEDYLLILFLNNVLLLLIALILQLDNLFLEDVLKFVLFKCLLFMI